uniref:Uncharacterized protein n=1 Tax=Anguilla anguilla TaxID=7936 RepID=A0A0E9PW27_ANGAN
MWNGNHVTDQTKTLLKKKTINSRPLDCYRLHHGKLAKCKCLCNSFYTLQSLENLFRLEPPIVKGM